MFNLIRKVFHLAPYNRPKPSLKDFTAKDFTTMKITATPAPTIIDTGEGFLLRDNGKIYSRRRDAIRGWNRMYSTVNA